MLTVDNVLLIDMRGAVTRSAVVALVRSMGASAYSRAGAFVVRADRALMMMGAQCLASIQAQEVLPISGALVVPESALEMAQDYAARMARCGIVRRAFTDREKALTWATQQARLALAQELWVRARRPSPAIAG